MKTDMRKELQSLVARINERFEHLKGCNGDVLRDVVRQLEETIASDYSKLGADECCLVESFAAMKSLAYQLSHGDVKVKATPLDRKMAEEADFVKIEGDVAVYRRSWRVMGNESVWNMVHYDEQLMGGILLHRGYATQMATGEGKTLVATLPVLLNGLSHRGVHVMTVNNYLSRRDFEITRPLYSFFGLTAGCIENSRHRDLEHAEAYRKDIVFGTNHQFTFDYLYDHLSLSPEGCVQTNHHFAIIDELDSILIDCADIPHIIGSGSIDETDSFKSLNPIIKELLDVKDRSLYKLNETKTSVKLTKEGEKWIEQKLGEPGLYKKEDPNLDLKALPFEERKNVIDRRNKKNNIFQLIKAYTIMIRDVDYIVQDSKIYIIDEHTGRALENNRWSYGLHTAVEVKEGVPLQNDDLASAVISLENYFKLYDKIAGMSGTITPVAPELKSVYGLNTAELPSHRPIIRKDLSPKIFRTKEKKLEGVVNEIKRIHKKGRPVLVGSISVKSSEELALLLDEAGVIYTKLNAKTEEDESLIIAKAGEDNAITLSTSIAGRGTDIKISEQSYKNGGLAILSTDMFESVRIDMQLNGRSGRQGDPGTSQSFLSLEDEILQNLSKEERTSLKNIADQMTDENLSSDEIYCFFRKAQDICEKEAYVSRKNTSIKDDIIAPQRKRFYDARNGILFDPVKASQFIDKIILDSADRKKKDYCLDKLYRQSCILTKRIKSADKVTEKIDIPFSDSRHVYTVKFDAKHMLSDFKYYKDEYMRQIILQTFDKYWIRLVQHMMEDLSKKEIEKLPEDYDEMMKNIEVIVGSRMMNPTIPIFQKEMEDLNTEKKETNVIRNAKNILFKIDPLQPCPCRSGKPFGECHGKRETFKRRR